MTNYKNGSLIILKQSYKTEIEESVGFISNDPKQRPVMLAFEDNKTQGLYYAIPLTMKEHLSDNKQRQIENMINGDTPLSSYYEPVKILGKEYYAKIRDIKPITLEYIEREFTNFNQPTRVTNKNKLETIQNKSKLVLGMSIKNPHFFEQNPNKSKELLESKLQNQKKKKK